MGIIKNYTLPLAWGNIFISDKGIVVEENGKDRIIIEKEISFYNPDRSLRPAEEILSEAYSYLFSDKFCIEDNVDSEFLKRCLDDDELMKFLGSFKITDGGTDE